MKPKMFLMSKTLFLLFTVVFLAISCGESKDGELNEACFSNGTCHDGLVCNAEKICIEDKCLSKSCEFWQECKPETGACELKANYCVEDKDCGTEKPICSHKTMRCTANKCANVICEAGQACESETGECVVTNKCENIACEDGQVCDPGTGMCLVLDLCAGIICEENEVCNSNTGVCESFNVSEINTIVKARQFSSASSSTEGILLTEYLEGVVVAIRGTETSKKHHIVIQQADATEYAAVYVPLDGLKDEADFPVFAVGNLVSFKGKLIEYFNRTQVEPQTLADITIKAAKVDLPAPVDLASDAFEEKYESMLVNITNVPMTVTEAVKFNRCDSENPCADGVECKNGQCADNVYDTTLTDATNRTLKVSSSFTYPRVELQKDQVVSGISGVMTFDYGEFKLFPTAKEEVTIQE